MLSYHGVKFFLHRVSLSDDLRNLYDRCVRFWGLLLELAQSQDEGGKGEDGGPGKMFWMYHQAFFLGLITAVKVRVCLVPS
jgi:hypothetical protein